MKDANRKAKRRVKAEKRPANSSEIKSQPHSRALTSRLDLGNKIDSLMGVRMAVDSSRAPMVSSVNELHDECDIHQAL